MSIIDDKIKAAQEEIQTLNAEETALKGKIQQLKQLKIEKERKLAAIEALKKEEELLLSSL